MASHVSIGLVYHGRRPAPPTLGLRRRGGEAPAWTTYLAADDADETAAKITKVGGQPFVDPFDVMDAR
jgi:predicted enzyme related to lactoylglutathione lyase